MCCDQIRCFCFPFIPVTLNRMITSLLFSAHYLRLPERPEQHCAKYCERQRDSLLEEEILCLLGLYVVVVCSRYLCCSDSDPEIMLSLADDCTSVVIN